MQPTTLYDIDWELRRCEKHLLYQKTDLLQNRPWACVVLGNFLRDGKREKTACPRYGAYVTSQSGFYPNPDWGSKLTLPNPYLDGNNQIGCCFKVR